MTYVVPPSLPNQRWDHERRLAALEARQLPTYPAGSPNPPAVFSMPGALTVATSGRWYPGVKGVEFTVVKFNVATAGSGSTVDVMLNGSTVLTVTLGGGANSITVPAGSLGPLPVGPSDYLQVACTTPGGASDATVQLYE